MQLAPASSKQHHPTLRLALALVLITIAMLAIAAFSVAPEAQQVAAPQAAYDKVGELLKPSTGVNGNVRGVAASGDYAYALTTAGTGSLLVYDTSSVTGTTFTTLDTPVDTLGLSSKFGLIRDGSTLYAYGLNGVQPIDITLPDQPSVGAESGGPVIYNAVLSGGYLVGAARDVLAIYELAPAPTLVHTATIGVGNWAYSVAVLDDVIIAGYYQGSTTGFKIFEYQYLDDFAGSTTVSTPDLAYHLRVYGDRLVACTSDSLDLYNITDPTSPTYLGQEQLGGASWGRACVVDGENLVTNGEILRVDGDAFSLVDSFAPDSTLSDGFPYTAVAEGGHIYMPQSGRVLMVTRAPSGPAPVLDLVPGWAGLDTDIGVRSLTLDGARCGWQPDEQVTIWWDSPELPLAAFTADANGCFEGMMNLASSEQLAGSPPGPHKVEARGQQHTVQADFEQMVAELHVSPSHGPGTLPVDIDGCGWNGLSVISVFWLDTGEFLTKSNVDPGTGCISASGAIPGEREEGLYALAGTPETTVQPGVRPADSSGAAFWLKNPTLALTPPEGPPGARVPVDGCNWYPDGAITFSWLPTGEVFDTLDVGPNGCLVSSFTSLDPRLRIPVTATLGATTIRATGVDSVLRLSMPFTVMQPSLAFAPGSGFPGDPTDVSGCGWVENGQVTLEWGYPDTNSLPIRWNADVVAETGCFSRSIDVPDNTITGPVVVTATGDVVGEATTVFAVTHSGTISIPDDDVVAGGSVSVEVSGGIIGESIAFTWFDGTFLTAIGVVTPDFTLEVPIPLGASAGYQTIYANGTKGFSDSARVYVNDFSSIAINSTAPYYSGSTIQVEGTDWGAGERVVLGLRASDFSFRALEATTVADDASAFLFDLDIPSDVAAASYMLEANGSKGRNAERGITITTPPPPAFSMTAAYADPAPVLDGVLRQGEWNYFSPVAFANGTLSARSDENRLYLLLNVLADDVEDLPGDDNFAVTIDVYGNRQIDSGVDLNFALNDAGDLVLQEYTSPGSLNNRNVSFMRSAVAPGFGCFTADNTFDISAFLCDSHRVFEIGIDLPTIQAEPGDTVRVGIRMESASPAILESIPADFTTDFAHLGEITLAASRLPADPPDGQVAAIGVGGSAIEVTQAVQDTGNTLSLVADKATAVRVYPSMVSTGTVRVFLYGGRGGVDLAGSPLVTLATVPPSAQMDRNALGHTANFALPKSWTASGALQLVAIAESLDGASASAESGAVGFQTRRVPVIWTIPINEGTAAMPSLPDMAAVARQEDVLESMFPVPDVTWVRQSWAAIGATGAITTEQAKTQLKQYYSDLQAAWAQGSAPAQPPDIVYGHLPTCDPDGTIGTSDPIWTGGAGIVAIGCPTDGKQANMAHEVNHNLDRRIRSLATWGRHSGGCGAEQGDTNWPFLTGTMTTTINEVGFDSRLPWSDGSDGNMTVFPASWSEFMSYCRMSTTTQPTQWISAYRWGEMYTTFGLPLPAAQAAGRATAQDVHYISGHVNRDGSGALDPVSTLPGFPTGVIDPGDYALELQTAAGTPLDTVPFSVFFTGVEGNELNSVFFDYKIAAHAETGRIVLKHGGDVLDTVVASSSEPSVTVTAPSGGENWSGLETIEWDAHDDDGDPMTFRVLYSPDAGARWLPLASGLSGSSLVVDAGALPGGTGGKIRVTATDGFHTVQADSAGAFTVPPSAPLVSIDSPADGDVFPDNTWIDLRGSASDAFGTSYPAESFVWSVDGEPVDVGLETTLLLESGEHTILLSVSSGGGPTGEATVTISVFPAAGGRLYLPLVLR